MAQQVLIRDFPHHEIALVTDHVALIFRHSPVAIGDDSRGAAKSHRCIVEFSPKTPSSLDGFRARSNAYGTLGLMTLDGDVFLCVITGSSQVATVRPDETVQRIHAVDFCRSAQTYFESVPD